MSETCPPQERWKQHLDGTLPAEQQALLTAHLDQCGDCRQTLEMLAVGGDSLLDVARQAGDRTEASSPALDEVLEKCRAPSVETQADPVCSADESLSFLSPSSKPGHIGRLGHYEVQQLLGKGGFGVVLKAFDEKLHRVVAIKVLSPAYAANGSARKRFIREARAAAAVKNEHVVGIYDVQDEAQPPYLVMEIIDGVSLQDKLDKQGPLSVTEILRIGMQTAEGLAAAHKQGLVHRDIKPANILLENGVERVKITDFGLARAVDDASVTQSGTVAGTPMYMSPEQAEGLAVDHRSDLFSLGSVLYMMCTGHPPFRASGTHAVLKRVIDAVPRPIREVNPDIPEWLCELIAKLHAKRPEDRFQTAKEVAERLANCLSLTQLHGVSATGTAAPAAPSGPAETSANKYKTMLGLGLATIGAAGLIAFLSMTMEGHGGSVFTFRMGQPDAWFIWESASGVDVNFIRWSILFGVVGAGCITWGVRSLRAGAPRSRRLRGLAIAVCVVAVVGVLNGFFLFLMPPHLDRDDGHNKGSHAVKAFVPVFGGPGWRRLFNGKDLTGWKEFGDAVAGDGQILLFPGGAVDTLDKMPREFRLRMEVKLVTGQGTIRFHAQPRKQQPNPPYPKDGWFLFLREKAGTVNAELHSRSPAAEKGALNTTFLGTNLKCGEWFYLEIVAENNSARLLVDGSNVQVPGDPYNAGVISLWNDGRGESRIAFRNVEIKDLMPPAYKDDKERLQGNWVAESVDNGRQLPKEAYAECTMTIVGNKMTMRTFLPESSDSIFHLNETATPKQIDMIDEDHNGQFGIYRFDGDRLFLCVGGDDEKDRPAEFSSKGGNRRMVIVFKRVAQLPPSAQTKAGRIKAFRDLPLAASLPRANFPHIGDVTRGEGGWKIVAGANGVIPLYRSGKLEVQKGTLIFRATVKSNNLPKNAYLRMDLMFGNKLVTCPVSQAITGVSDWRLLDSRYVMDENHIPDSATLNAVFDGPGIIWIKNAEILYAPGPGVTNAQPPEDGPAAALLRQVQANLLKAEVVEIRWNGFWKNNDRAIDGSLSLSAKDRKLIARSNVEDTNPYTKSSAGDGVPEKMRCTLEAIGRAGAFVPSFLLESFADDVKERSINWFTDPRQLDASTPILGGTEKIDGRQAQIIEFTLRSKNGLLVIQNKVWIDIERRLPIKWKTTATRGQKKIVVTEKYEKIELTKPASPAAGYGLEFDGSSSQVEIRSLFTDGKQPLTVEGYCRPKSISKQGNCVVLISGPGALFVDIGGEPGFVTTGAFLGEARPDKGTA
jgi:uncharacterized protein (TIGR03067 family)